MKGVVNVVVVIANYAMSEFFVFRRGAGLDGTGDMEAP